MIFHRPAMMRGLFPCAGGSPVTLLTGNAVSGIAAMLAVTPTVVANVLQVLCHATNEKSSTIRATCTLSSSTYNTQLQLIWPWAIDTVITVPGALPPSALRRTRFLVNLICSPINSLSVRSALRSLRKALPLSTDASWPPAFLPILCHTICS